MPLAALAACPPVRVRARGHSDVPPFTTQSLKPKAHRHIDGIGTTSSPVI
jgi:hypothetical protein